VNSQICDNVRSYKFQPKTCVKDSYTVLRAFVVDSKFVLTYQDNGTNISATLMF